MKLNKRIYLLLFILLLSGCNVNYNLEIDKDRVTESFDIINNENEKLVEYALPLYIGVKDYQDLETDYFEKDDKTEYYDSKIINDKTINYSHSFSDNNYRNANALNIAYETLIIQQYDHDEDGKNDYMLMTTDDNFNIFKMAPKIEKITVNINCHYKIVSSNADKTNNNVLTWYITKDNIKPINIVYDPKKYIDNRTFWEKIMEGQFINIFTISCVLLIIGFIIYKIINAISEKRNAI